MKRPNPWGFLARIWYIKPLHWMCLQPGVSVWIRGSAAPSWGRPAHVFADLRPSGARFQQRGVTRLHAFHVQRRVVRVQPPASEPAPNRHDYPRAFPRPAGAWDCVKGENWNVFAQLFLMLPPMFGCAYLNKIISIYAANSGVWLVLYNIFDQHVLWFELSHSFQLSIFCLFDRIV